MPERKQQNNNAKRPKRHTHTHTYSCHESQSSKLLDSVSVWLKSQHPDTCRQTNDWLLLYIVSLCVLCAGVTCAMGVCLQSGWHVMGTRLGKVSGLQFSQYKKTKDFHRETQKTTKETQNDNKGTQKLLHSDKKLPQKDGKSTKEYKLGNKTQKATKNWSTAQNNGAHKNNTHMLMFSRWMLSMFTRFLKNTSFGA